MFKENIERALKEQNLSKMQASLMAGISPADFYQALNGKKPFFPKWRKSISKVLKMTELELFQEYQKTADEVFQEAQVL